jgi:putative ABC transport system permease protein
MLRNYLKIAWRNLTKNKVYFVINTLGLAIGMAASLLILSYVAHERSYDDFHPGIDRLFRVELDSYQNGKLAFKSATSYPAIAPTLKKDYPEVEETARLYDANSSVVAYENNRFREDNYYFADSSIFRVLHIPFVQGDPATALQGPGKVVISETIARKYFGTADPMGKTLKLDRDAYQVRGVFRDFPKASHLELDLLFSYLTNREAQTSWGWYDFFTYVKLRPGTDPARFEAKMKDLVERYEPRYKKLGYNTELLLQPVRDIHLTSRLNQEAEVNGNGGAVTVLALIAFFILAIAWINYINLATARAVDRAKEVGIRKAVGAERAQLVRQFLFESALLNLIAVGVAVFLVNVSLPAFVNLTGKPVSLDIWFENNRWLPALAVFGLGLLLSGLYPAFVLSGFRPVAVLKGKIRPASGGLSLRQALIVLQFTASIVLIIGTITVYRQLRFMQERDLGFNPERTLVLQGAGVRDSTYEARANSFKQELIREGLVTKATASAYVPGIEILWTNSAQRLDFPNASRNTFYFTSYDYEFVDAYEIKLAAGRNFSRQFGTDRKGALINETAAELLGFTNPAEAIGKRIGTGDTLTVVGVVKNYHQQGLQKGHWPMIIRLLPDNARFFSLKLADGGDLDANIARIRASYDEAFPGNSFDYFFLDTFFNEQYKADRQFGKVCGIFAGLAIFIACLGLFALATFMAEQRTKEIGIRKVLGASEAGIVGLLSRDFLKLVLIALLLATPLAWYALNRWLQDFAYHTNLPWWSFALAGLLAVGIALLTVSYQSIKAASMNPVKSLRTE